MTSVTQRLLEELRTRYDATSDSVTATELAERLNTEREVVKDHLEHLEGYELVKAVPGEPGYRPTVTAREFLDLNLDHDGFFIFEMSDERNG